MTLEPDSAYEFFTATQKLYHEASVNQVVKRWYELVACFMQSRNDKLPDLYSQLKIVSHVYISWLPA